MKTLIDGAKNAVLVFSGEMINGCLLSLEKLSGSPKSVRLEGLLYAFEFKAVLTLGEIVIPLAGRGKLNFEEFHALPFTEDVHLTTDGLYFIMLDMEKL